MTGLTLKFNQNGHVVEVEDEYGMQKAWWSSNGAFYLDPSLGTDLVGLLSEPLAALLRDYGPFRTEVENVARNIVPTQAVDSSELEIKVQQVFQEKLETLVEGVIEQKVRKIVSIIDAARESKEKLDRDIDAVTGDG